MSMLNPLSMIGKFLGAKMHVEGDARWFFLLALVGVTFEAVFCVEGRRWQFNYTNASTEVQVSQLRRVEDST